MGETINTPEMDETREALKQALGARRLSVALAAKEIDIGYSTLSSWLAVKYNGDNAAVADKVRTWLRHQEDLARHRAALPTLPDFVNTPTAGSILAILMHAQTVPDIVLVTGGAGIGKTTACAEYRRRHPNVWMHTAEPAGSSVHAMIEGICDAMGVRENAASRRSPEIVRRATGSGGLLIIDEAKHLGSAALDQLRTFHDKAQIGIAVSGNSEVFARIDGDGRRGLFAQFRSRVGMRISRANPLGADVEAILSAANVYGDPERRLLRVVANKPGALRGVAKTLRVAHILAAADGTDISEAHIKAAAERLTDAFGEAA